MIARLLADGARRDAIAASAERRAHATYGAEAQDRAYANLYASLRHGGSP